MDPLISIVQNSGVIYSGYSQEVAKPTSYFLSEDNALGLKTESPVTIPEEGTNYSYEIYMRCRCDLAPNDRVDNFKVWYKGGMPLAGYKVTVNDDIINGYLQPKNSLSEVGNRVDFLTKDSEVNSIALEGSLSHIGDYTSWLIFQLEILSTAETGAFGVSYTIQYDQY